MKLRPPRVSSRWWPSTPTRCTQCHQISTPATTVITLSRLFLVVLTLSNRSCWGVRARACNRPLVHGGPVRGVPERRHLSWSAIGCHSGPLCLLMQFALCMLGRWRPRVADGWLLEPSTCRRCPICLRTTATLAWLTFAEYRTSTLLRDRAPTWPPALASLQRLPRCLQVQCLPSHRVIDRLS